MISIIVPFYNTEKYITECLVSIQSQTFSDFECLMIDDGSTDSSRMIAQEFATKDSRFKLLNDHHIGFPQAKNLGIDSAKGEYICFLDSDDYILPKYLELLYQGLISSNSDICICRLTRFKNNDEPRILEREYEINTFTGDSKIKCMFHSTFMWDKIYKKELFDGLRFENVMALSDTKLIYKIFEKAESVSRINQTLVCHRDHEENMTYHVRNFEPTYWEYRLNVYIEMCTYLFKYPGVNKLVRSIFLSEFLFFKKHSTTELFELYYNKPVVKEPLKGSHI